MNISDHVLFNPQDKALVQTALRAFWDTPAGRAVRLQWLQEKVLGTAELFESILIQLPESRIVLAARVSKLRQNTIRHSQSLQERLFLRFRKNDRFADDLHVSPIWFPGGLSTVAKVKHTPLEFPVSCRRAVLTNPERLFQHTTATPQSYENQMVLKPFHDLILVKVHYLGLPADKTTPPDHLPRKFEAWIMNRSNKGVTMAQVAKVFGY